MIVVDASAILEVLIRSVAASNIEQRIFASGQTLHAPHLLDVEIANVLRRREAVGELGHPRGLEALYDLADLPILRYPQHFFLPRIWRLRNNLSAHDAAYVALAEELDAPLLTRDQRIGRAFGHHARIEIV